jgi:hypothetical protein
MYDNALRKGSSRPPFILLGPDLEPSEGIAESDSNMS